MKWSLLFFFFLTYNLFSFDFPKNHSFHQDYKVEWIYFVGHIQTEKGEKFGYELSFFKGIIADKIEVFPVHFAISDLKNKKHYTTQTIHRKIGNLVEYNQALVRSGDYKIVIEDKTKFKISAKPRNENFSIELNLTSTTQDILLHGKNGFSIKSRKFPQINSNYYSIPKLNSTGIIKLNGIEHKINSGSSWMDHEWSSKIGEEETINLSSKEISWDWISLNFEDGSSLMAFNFRKDNESKSESFGTYRDKNGKEFIFEKEGEIVLKSSEEIWKSKITNKKYKLYWEVKFLDLAVEVSPIFNEQEFIALQTTGNIYWEGAMKAKIISKQNIQNGFGYLELKGY